MASMEISANANKLLNTYFITPVISINSSITKLNTSVRNLNTSVSNINNYVSLLNNDSIEAVQLLNELFIKPVTDISNNMLTDFNLLDTSITNANLSITRLNTSVIANTSSIIDINSSISGIKTTASTLNTTVSNLSVYVTNFNTSVNLSVADINSSISGIKTTASTLNTTVSNLSNYITNNNTSLTTVIDSASSTILSIGGTNGTSSQSYAGSLTSGTLNIATAITTGNINIGSVTASNQVKVGGVLVGTNAINAGTDSNFQIASTNISSSISIGSAQTSGVLNIGTNASRTASINIGNATNTGAINIQTASLNNTYENPAILIGGGTGTSGRSIRVGNSNNNSTHFIGNLAIATNVNNNNVCLVNCVENSATNDLNIGGTQTSGKLNLGGGVFASARTSGGEINIGVQNGNTCPINIMNSGGATTGGSVNIANGTLQTTTVNIASGTGTGTVTIGNSANTTRINSKNIEIGNNANTSNIIIGPLSQTASLNISTVVNGVRIDSHTTNNNLLLSFGNIPYKVTSSGGDSNVCNTAVSNWAFKDNTMTGHHCTAVGHNCLTKNSTGIYNIAIGSDTLANVTTGGYNTALGGRALTAATTNSSQVAIGYNALSSSVTSGYPNVAVGHGALQNYSGAGGNVAVGYNALASLTTGLGNIAIGYIADNAPNVATVNTTGHDNVIIGTDACSGNNSRCIVIGHSAAANANDQIIIGKSTGAHTTYIQGSGGFNVTRGITNLKSTAIYEEGGNEGGATAGSLTISHGNNGGVSSIIFPSKNNYGSDYGYIRYRDDVNNAGGGNEAACLEIGLENDGNDNLILQKGIGLVGIGKTNPGHKLDVTGNMGVSGTIFPGGISTGGQIVGGYIGSTGNMYAATLGVGIIPPGRTFAVTGKVSIGDNSHDLADYGTVNICSDTRDYPQLSLIRAGNVAWQIGTFGASNNFRISSGNGVQLSPGSQSWTGTSDRKLKTNIEPIENPIEKINNLNGIYFKFKIDKPEQIRRVGVIAQDVQVVLPEIIDECMEKGETYLGVRYTELIPLLIEGIKAQQVKIDLQQSQIDSQQSQIDALMARLTALENKM